MAQLQTFFENRQPFCFSLSTYFEMGNSEHDPPPPYTPYSSEKAATSFHTRSLRRFLSFCLAVDYDLVQESPDMLTESEWHHMVRLSRLCFEDFCQNQPQTSELLYLWQTLPTNKIIVEELIIPSEALGICPRRVLYMTRVFISSMNYAAGYHSEPEFCFHHVTGNIKDVAEKLVYDLEEMFPKVLPRDDCLFKAKMYRAHGAVSRRYFVTLERHAFKLTTRGLWMQEHQGGAEARWMRLRRARREYAAVADIALLLSVPEARMRQLSWWQRYQWRRAKCRESFLYSHGPTKPESPDS